MSPRPVSLYLDDERPAPAGWLCARTLAEAVAVMEDPELRVVRMSLDHDLGVCGECERGGVSDCSHTGYRFALWCAEHDRWSDERPSVHSMNPVGRASIAAVIGRYWHPPTP